MFWHLLDTFKSTWGIAVKYKNKIWHKSECCNVLSDFWFEVHSAIFWPFLLAAAAASGGGASDNWRNSLLLVIPTCIFVFTESAPLSQFSHRVALSHRDTLFWRSWRPLVKGRIANIGMQWHNFSFFLPFPWFFIIFFITFSDEPIPPSHKKGWPPRWPKQKWKLRKNLASDIW